MSRPQFIVRLLAVSLCAAALMTAPALADDAVLKVIPKNSMAFAVVNGLEKADQVCKELGEATQMPIPSPAMLLKQASGLSDSLDMDGDMAAVLFSPEGKTQGPPPVIVILPVKDFDKMISEFDAEKVSDTIQKVTVNGMELVVASKEGYALLTQATDQDALEALLAAKESIVEEMKPWADWAAKNTVYGVLTNYGIKVSMKEGIESLEGTLESFDQFGESSPQLDQIKKSLGLYLLAMKGIRDNANQLGAGLSKAESGAIKLSTRCDVTPEGGLAKMLEEVKALPADPMSTLPAGPFVFAAGGPIPQKAMVMLMEFFKGMSGTQMGLSAEQNEKMTQLSIDAMKAMIGESFILGAPGTDTKSLMDTAAVAMWVEDADAYLASYQEQIKKMNALFAEADTFAMKMEAKETTIDGNKVIVVTNDLSGLLDLPEFAPVAEFSKSLYGENMTITAYIVKVSDTLLVSVMGDESKLAKAIEVAKTKSGSLAEESSVKDVAAMLPSDAQWIVYWSPDGTVDLVNWIITKLPESMTENMTMKSLPDFIESPPVGIAVKIEKNTVEKTLVFPPDTIRGMVMFFMQLRMAGPH